MVAALAGLVAVVTPALLAAPLPGAPACPMFPADSHWRADVSRLPVHPNSAAYVASAGAGNSLHPDFGSGLWEGCLLYTSPSPRDVEESRMPSSA